MSRNADYRILPEFRLILECCKGQATVEEVLRMKNDEIADPLYNPDYNILVDFHEFEAMIDKRVDDSAYEFFNFLKNLGINGRIALFTAKPVQVVASLILKRLYNRPGTVHIEVFSTVRAAIKHLGIPDKNSKSVIENMHLLSDSMN